MGLQVLALQAARASGAEPTFDGQAMQAGMHVRWSFTPQLGFPPGAFWLLRRVGSDDEKRIVPPIAVQQAIDNAVASDPAQGGLGCRRGRATRRPRHRPRRRQAGPGRCRVPLWLRLRLRMRL